MADFQSIAAEVSAQAAPKKYTIVDFVSDQLRAQNTATDWNTQGIDRARELALILIRNNIIDLSKLQLTVVNVREAGFSFSQEYLQVHEGLAFLYEGRTIGFMGTPDRADREPEFEQTLIAWSAAGHGNVGYDIEKAPGGFRIAVHWASSSDAAEIRGEILQVASLSISLVLPLAGVNVAAMLGNAVLTPIFGTVSPMIAAAVGQTALSTVFNGGDVEKAVRDVVVNLAASQFGAQVGGRVGNLTESRLAVTLAASATAAVVSGKNVQTAIGFSLVKAGFGAASEPASEVNTPSAPAEIAPAPSAESVSMSAPASAPAPEPVEGNVMSYDGDPYSSDALNSEVVDISTVDTSFWTGPVSNWWEASSPVSDVAPTLAPSGDAYSTTADIRSQLIAAEQQAAENPVKVDDSWGNSFKDIVTNIGTFGAGAIAIIKTIDRVKTVVTNSRTTNPDGSITVALDSGLVITKDKNGNVISSQRPPVGVGQTTASGNIVANLGNGTYSLTTPEGSRRVIKYDPALSSGSFFDIVAANPTPFVLGGVGLIAALVKARGR